MDDLIAFEDARTAAQKLQVVESLVKAKTLNRVSKAPGFIEALRALGPLLHSTNPAEAWSAAAAVARIATASRSLMPELRAILNENFVTVPEELPTFEDVENRKYAVAALRLGQPDWRTLVFARIAVLEESAESVREESINGLLEATADVATAVDALTAQLLAFRAETSDAAATIAKRLRRILRSVRNVWAVNPFEPGPRIGLALALIAEQPFRRVGVPQGDLRKELALLIASLVHQAVRARFSYATDPKTYAPIEVPRGWFSGGEWNEIVNADELQDLRSDVSEALRLLVRAGVTDDRLLKVAESVAGNVERARSLLEDVAQRIPDAGNEGTAWLLGKRLGPATSSLANESRLRDVDDILANVLVAEKTTRSQEAADAALMPALIRDLRAACDARGLVVFGGLDQEMEYSPARHELEGGHRAGVRLVRVVQPGVESVLDSRRIVRKALVAPIE